MLSRSLAIASGLIGDNDALDRVPGLLSLFAPTMQELQQRLLIRIEFLSGWRLMPGTSA
jgi:hypothetical protein